MRLPVSDMVSIWFDIAYAELQLSPFDLYIGTPVRSDTDSLPANLGLRRRHGADRQTAGTATYPYEVPFGFRGGKAM